jgi:hypothetical protein
MGKRGKALKRKRNGLEMSSAPVPDVGGNSESENDSAKRVGSDSESESGEGANNVDDMLGGLTPEELETAIKVVSTLGKRLELFRSRPFKGMRVAIHPLVREQIRRFETSDATAAGGGKNRRDRRGGCSSIDADDEFLAGTNRGRLNHLTPAERRKQMDRDALNARLLRAERLERLEALNAIGEDEAGEEVRRFRVPDGVAGLLTFSSVATPETGREGAGSATESKLLEADNSTHKGTDSTLALVQPSTSRTIEDSKIGAPTRLHHSIGCYICKAPFQVNVFRKFLRKFCTCTEDIYRYRERDGRCVK